MTKDEALDLALEVLETGQNHGVAIDKLRRYIKQARSAPVQGCDYCNHPLYAGTKCKNCGTSPVQDVSLIDEGKTAAQRQWVGLTDEEVMQLAFNFDVPSLVIRTAEAKLKEKNT